MSSFQYEKTQNVVSKSKKKELISTKKYLLAKDEDNQKYAVFHLINNYKENVNRIVLIINQYDKDGNLLATNEVPYENLNIKSHGRFVPFFKLALDDLTEKIDTNVTEADFENHKYQNGKLVRVKKEKKQKTEEEKKVLDKIDYNVKTKKSSYPLKSFLLLTVIVLVIMAIFVGLFSFSNKSIMYKDMSFNTATGTVEKYYGSSMDLTIPEKIKNVEVKKIANRAFMGTTVKHLYIDSENIVIGDYAFCKCKNLETVVANNIETIGVHAFENCVSLNLMGFDSVGIVREGAFMGCQRLKEFSSDTCEKIETLAFVDCYSLEKVNVPNATLTNLVFENNENLEELTFKSTEEYGVISLRSIFSNTIEYSSLVINTYMERIQTYFIDDFKYKRINFLNPNVIFEGNVYNTYIEKATREGQVVNQGLYTKVYDTIVSFDTSRITENLVISDNNIKGIMLNGLKTNGRVVTKLYFNTSMIVTSEFMNCFPNLTEIEFGPSVKIAEGAIGTSRLTKITMPVVGEEFVKIFKFLPMNLEVVLNGSRSIPDYYLKGASTIKTLRITGAISKIGKEAISDCANLTDLYIDRTVNEMSLPIINGAATKLANVKIPYIGSTINDPCKYLDLNQSGAFTKKLVIDSSVPIEFAENAFDRVALINYISIEGGISGENPDLFSPLRSLTHVIIGGRIDQKLVEMGLSKTTNLAIKATSVADGFCDACQITNLYIAGTLMITDKKFSSTNNISNIYLSRYCYLSGVSSYDQVFDSIIMLKTIDFGNPSAQYEGDKTVNKGIDFSALYSDAFN